MAVHIGLRLFGGQRYIKAVLRRFIVVMFDLTVLPPVVHTYCDVLHFGVQVPFLEQYCDNVERLVRKHGGGNAILL